MSKYPFRHLSIRVPWHDLGWDGRVCSEPLQNAACLKLKRIGQSRNDEAEHDVRGKSIEDLDPEQWPCCLPERAMFMAPFEYTRMASHPYVKTSPETHGHFQPTALRHPRYSAPAVPFRWMLSENAEALRDEYDLDVDMRREPDLPFKTQWVQELRNQRALLDCFFGHAVANKSLCFFYAKQIPLVEESNRVLVGVARVTNIGGPTEYKTAKGAPFSGLLWENMVAHSLRPDFSDGFLLPYHAAIRMTEQDPDFDLTQVLAVPPEDRRLEFSYGTEHVSNDAALRSLLACAAALNNAKRGIPGPWDQCLDWIDSRLLEVETLRGPCPGLGAALSAFGVEQAALIARELEAKAGDNEDPWPVAEKVFKSAGSVLPPALQSKIGPTLKDIWKSLEPERKVLLKLVSRFELTKEQAALIYVREKRAKVGITATDEQIIKNPYVIFELTRDKVEPVSVFTIDAGVFPDTTIREKHPLPSSSRVDESIDVRRVRAFTVELLEQGAAAGNTLLARADVVNSIRDLKLKPPSPATGDSLSVAEKIFAGIVDKAQAADSSPA